jgi:hypothetical protein
MLVFVFSLNSILLLFDHVDRNFSCYMFRLMEAERINAYVENI